MRFSSVMGSDDDAFEEEATGEALAAKNCATDEPGRPLGEGAAIW